MAKFLLRKDLWTATVPKLSISANQNCFLLPRTYRCHKICKHPRNKLFPQPQLTFYSKSACKPKRNFGIPNLVLYSSKQKEFLILNFESPKNKYFYLMCNEINKIHNIFAWQAYSKELAHATRLVIFSEGKMCTSFILSLLKSINCMIQFVIRKFTCQMKNQG